MNILFFCDHPIVATDGGISRITDSLVGIFRNYGHSVFILSAKKGSNANVDENHFYLPNSEYNEECLLYAIRFCKDNLIELIVCQSATTKSTIFFLEELKKNLTIKVYCCIHNCTVTPILNYAYQKEFILRERKMTLLFHLLKSKCVKKMLLLLYYFKYRKLYTKIADVSDQVLVLNNKLMEEYQFFIPKRYYSKIIIVPNCLPIREWNCKKTKEKILLWVGRLDISVKRIDLMLKAWHELYKVNPNWKLEVLGDGPYLSYAKNFSKINHLENVSFEGRVNPYPYYEKASLVAVTSSHESFSLVILEALQHNVVPVVMNTFPFASTIIQDGENGVLVDEYNYESLIKSLDLIMKNENQLKRLSKNGPKTALIYSPENIYKKYWERILK